MADSLPGLKEVALALAKIAPNGLGRPLYGNSTAADISALLTVAQATGIDTTLPVTKQVVEVVLPAVQPLEGPSKLAACRLLWIESAEDFTPARGKRIPLEGDDGRYAYAASALGVSPQTFVRRKRGPLLDEIAEQILIHAERVQVPDPSPTVHEPQRPLDAFDPAKVECLYLHALAEASIDLHYSGLAALFIYHLSHTLPFYRNSYGFESYFPSADSVYRASSELLFSNYCDLLVAFQLRREDEFRHEYAEGLSDAGRNQLGVLSSFCSDFGPARFYELDKRATEDPDYLSSLWHDDDFLYKYEWSPWYQKEVACPNPGDVRTKLGILPKPDNLQVITGASAAMFRTIREEVGFAVPFESVACETAYRQITGSYAFDQWIPIQNGLSLKELIAAYFEKQQSELDKLVHSML